MYAHSSSCSALSWQLDP